MTENEIARQIVDVAYHIHKAFGPGLLESAYEAMLAHDLEKRNLRVERQVPIPIIYDSCLPSLMYVYFLRIGRQKSTATFGKLFSSSLSTSRKETSRSFGITDKTILLGFLA